MTVAHASPRREPAICMGATERVAARLMAVRMPEAMVNARRSVAQKHAKKKGDTPSQAHLTLLAWNLFMTHVPPTLWPTPTIVHVSPLRWPLELLFQSWKSSRQFASLTTHKEDST